MNGKSHLFLYQLSERRPSFRHREAEVCPGVHALCPISNLSLSTGEAKKSSRFYPACYGQWRHGECNRKVEETIEGSSENIRFHATGELKGLSSNETFIPVNVNTLKPGTKVLGSLFIDELKRSE